MDSVTRERQLAAFNDGWIAAHSRPVTANYVGVSMSDASGPDLNSQVGA